MNKFLIAILATTISISIYSQISVTPLLDWFDMEQENVYYKDINNQLNDFEGTWLYSNGATSLKIILEKRTMYFNGRYYEDIIIGEYQYIENGVEKINTLLDLNNPNVEIGDHHIDGNSLFTHCNYFPLDNCVLGEIKLFIGISDPITPHYGEIFLHKRDANGSEALEASIKFIYSGGAIAVDEIKPNPSMPWAGEYLLIKQD